MILFAGIMYPARAQFFSSGQDPFSIRWKQIKTPDCRIIFPEEDQANAERFANLIAHARNTVPASLSVHTRNIPVIFHNRIVQANGFVVWAPRRMELNTLPPQDIYSQDWLEQLGLHEYRHVAQIDKLNQGITRLFSYVGGQQVPGMVMGMVPRWFLEGDAVHSETSFSASGRGRLPSFEMELRALDLSRGKIYFYDKMLNGSFRNYVPDYYQYGYKMVSYVRYREGNKPWEEVLRYTGRHPFMVIPFTLALKKYTGMNKAGLQEKAFSLYDSIWKAQDRQISPTPFTTLNRRKGKVYTDYRYPVYLDDNHVAVLKSGMGQTQELVLIDRGGKEKKITYTGMMDPVRLSSGGGRLVWAEIEPDPRWDNQSFSVIRRYDFGRGKITRLTRKSKYFAPSIDPEGRRIVAVKVSRQGASSLAILDASTGKELQVTDAPPGGFLIQPCWLDSVTIATIVLQQNHKSIQVLSLVSGKYTLLWNASGYEVSDLSASGHSVYFRASCSGIDNIYRYSVLSGQVWQITSSRFGAYNPSWSPDGREMVYSEYTANGFDVVAANPDTAFNALAAVKNIYNPVYEKVSALEKGEDLFTDIPQEVYPVKPYNKVLHLFNFHSWAPFYYDYNALNVNDPMIYPGVSLLSQNLLGTAYTQLGYQYFKGLHYLHADFTYKGVYPVFEFSMDYGGYPTVYRNGSTDSVLLHPNRTSMRWLTYLPLLYPMRSCYFEVYPFVSVEYANDLLYSQETFSFTSGKTYVNPGLILYHFRRQSARDIAPKFAQYLKIMTLSAPFNRDLFGSVVSGTGTLYFPGILPHHSISITAGYERQHFARYFFQTKVSLPMGSNELLAAEEVKTIQLAYRFPFLYPDLHISCLAYIKRLRAGLFYGWAEAWNGRLITDSHQLHSGSISSMGAELLGDFHLARSLFPFVGGFRYSVTHDFSVQHSQYELVFYADLNNLL